MTSTTSRWHSTAELYPFPAPIKKWNWLILRQRVKKLNATIYSWRTWRQALISHYYGYENNGKIGFNCQLLLSEIGLNTDSSHSTWFHKTVRFSRSKSSRFYMKKIWLSMFYSIQVGKEPVSVFWNFKNREIRTKSRWYGSTPSSCAKDLTISEGTGVTSLFHFHSRVLMCFRAPLRPTPKSGQIPFLRNTYNIRHYKKDNGNPTINYFISFMNFIVIEIHVLPKQNL